MGYRWTSRKKHDNSNQEDQYDAEKNEWRHRSTGPGHFAAATVLICITAAIFFGGVVGLWTSEAVGRGLMGRFDENHWFCGVRKVNCVAASSVLHDIRA